MTEEIKRGGGFLCKDLWFLEWSLGKICMFHKESHQVTSVSEWMWRELITNAQQIFVKQSYLDTFQMNCQGYGIAGIQPKSFAFAQCYKTIL